MSIEYRSNINTVCSIRRPAVATSAFVKIAQWPSVLGTNRNDSKARIRPTSWGLTSRNGDGRASLTGLRLCTRARKLYVWQWLSDKPPQLTLKIGFVDLFVHLRVANNLVVVTGFHARSVSFAMYDFSRRQKRRVSIWDLPRCCFYHGPVAHPIYLAIHTSAHHSTAPHNVAASWSLI